MLSYDDRVMMMYLLIVYSQNVYTTVSLLLQRKNCTHHGMPGSINPWRPSFNRNLLPGFDLRPQQPSPPTPHPDVASSEGETGLSSPLRGFCGVRTGHWSLNGSREHWWRAGWQQSAGIVRASCYLGSTCQNRTAEPLCQEDRAALLRDRGRGVPPRTPAAHAKAKHKVSKRLCSWIPVSLPCWTKHPPRGTVLAQRTEPCGEPQMTNIWRQQVL